MYQQAEKLPGTKFVAFLHKIYTGMFGTTPKMKNMSLRNFLWSGFLASSWLL